VRARWLCLAAATLVALLAGCGTVGISSDAGTQLTIYSSLPLHGPSAAVAEQIVGGEKLALAQVHGQVGRFKVYYYSLNDVNPTTGEVDPGLTAQDAKVAAQDPSTIAYLGDYNSGATAISLPLINAAGILQVSPASPYVGLVSSLDAGQDEPERFYPTGKRTFARLEPDDVVEAAAQVQEMRRRSIKRLYVLSDEDPFQVPLSELVASDARNAGIEVLGRESLNTKTGLEFTGEAEKIASSGARAVFFSGSPSAGAVALWRALYASQRGMRLFGSSALANRSFTSQIGPAEQNTLLSTPILPTSKYPASAQRVLADYERQFGTRPEAYALYGYEAMNSVLAALRAAGRHANNRQAVIDAFFAAHQRDSVIGSYSIQPDGQSTLTRYAMNRVVGGEPVFYRVLDVR
jgi:branched-chain amino acid transport system substrate-binding protein